MVDAQYHGTHDARCNKQLDGVDDIHGVVAVFIEENQVQDSRNAEVRIRRPGSPQNAPGGQGREVPGKEDLRTGGDDHVHERNGGLPHALKHAGGDLLHTEEEYAEAHDRNAGARIGGSIEHGGNGGSNDAHADKGGNGDEIGQTHGGVRPFHDHVPLLLGNGLGNNRHQGSRQGSGDDGGHINKGRSHAGEIAKEGGCLFYRKARHFQPPGNDEKIDIGNDRQHDVCQGYRNSQHQKPLDNMEGTLGLNGRILFLCQFMTPAAGHVIESDEYHNPRKSTRRCTKRSAGCAEFQSIGQENHGKGDHGDHPYHLFNDLGYRRRRHELEPLEIAAERSQKRSTEDGRRQGQKGPVSPLVTDNTAVHEPLGAKEQKGTEKEPCQRKGSHGNTEDLLSAVVIPDRIPFRHHDGNSHRKAGGGNRKAEQINRIGHLVQSDSFAPQKAGKVNPAEGADKFDNNTGHRKDQCALDKRIFTHVSPVTKNLK